MITATVTGNVGRKPELKDTRTGKKMCTFSVASTSHREGKEPETTWLDVVCFDELATGVGAQLDKGMRVVLSGQLSLETFQRKDGGEGTALRMVANEVGLTLRSRREREEEGGSRDERRPARESRQPW
jgi:single-strand DNA-binding protein